VSARATKYRTQEVAKTPSGWRVRSKREGGHVLRIAFPPGRRKKGAGKVVEVLHPKKEKNPCAVSRKNPEELLIYGLGALINPSAKSHRSLTLGGTQMPAGHKPGCKCPFCKRARGENPKRAPKRKLRAVRLGGKKRRRNPDYSDMASNVELFQKFHGRDPEEVLTLQMSAIRRTKYTALGDLDYLIVETPLGQRAKFLFSEADDVKLAGTMNGKKKCTQLYCVDGNQNLEGCLTADSLQKDFVDLGDCIEVQYIARKGHINAGEPTQYHHKFGEETGDRPRLMYDKLNQQIFFVGGDYFIDLKDSVSPGIEN
jgi:hypothetical protein